MIQELYRRIYVW